MNKELYITNLLNKIIENPQKALKNEDNSIYPAAFNCLLGLVNYINGDFNSALINFEDAKILFENNEDNSDKILYEFLLGFINYNENNNIYSLHYNNAKRYASKYAKEDLKKEIVLDLD